MGYQTDYRLELPDQDNATKVWLLCDLRESCDEAEYALTEAGGPSGEESRWYEHEDDMRKFSLKHPSVLMVLSGEGESSGDIWTKYFWGGKCQVAKARIEVDEFDHEKLR